MEKYQVSRVMLSRHKIVREDPNSIKFVDLDGKTTVMRLPKKGVFWFTSFDEAKAKFLELQELFIADCKSTVRNCKLANVDGKYNVAISIKLNNNLIDLLKSTIESFKQIEEEDILIDIFYASHVLTYVAMLASVEE